MTTAYVTHPRYLEHDLNGHPEHAGRLRAIWQALETSGLLGRLSVQEPVMAEERAILELHTPDYLALLNSLNSPTIPAVAYLNPDTYVRRTSYEVARLSAGGVMRAVDEVLSGRAVNALAAVRPPGHHALAGRAMGFCLLGNVPIAARFAQREYGLKRILIVDYDVHHGNGTEAMFYDDSNVLFVSSHQYPFYPGTGALQDIGQGDGEGYTINIPLGAGHGDASYARLYAEVLWPAAMRFQPELILVSAGFDAHWLDPLAGMSLSLTGYAHLTAELQRMAQALCGGRIVVVLEGGYHLEALAHGFVNAVRILLGDSEILDPLGPSPDRREPDVEPLIRRLKLLHGLD